jgi:hypothetical protein
MARTSSWIPSDASPAEAPRDASGGSLVLGGRLARIDWPPLALALAAMTLAETSAAKTAAAAKAAAMSTQVDSADADAETAMAEVDEAEAHQRYRDATTRAADRDRGATA